MTRQFSSSKTSQFFRTRWVRSRQCLQSWCVRQAPGRSAICWQAGLLLMCMLDNVVHFVCVELHCIWFCQERDLAGLRGTKPMILSLANSAKDFLILIHAFYLRTQASFDFSWAAVGVPPPQRTHGFGGKFESEPTVPSRGWHESSDSLENGVDVVSSQPKQIQQRRWALHVSKGLCSCLLCCSAVLRCTSRSFEGGSL